MVVVAVAAAVAMVAAAVVLVVVVVEAVVIAIAVAVVVAVAVTAVLSNYCYIILLSLTVITGSPKYTNERGRAIRSSLKGRERAIVK